MADAPALGAGGATRGGSSPLSPTAVFNKHHPYRVVFVSIASPKRKQNNPKNKAFAAPKLLDKSTF